MAKIANIIKNNRLMKSLTGLSIVEFELLLENFTKLSYEFAHQHKKSRLRAFGGGRKGALIDSRHKLFYILFFLKIYPTYDLAGFIFGVDRSRCCRWTKMLMVLLEKALGRVIVLPKRKVTSMDEMLEVCPDAKDLFIDATERPMQRPKKAKKRIKTYSGKKKVHSRKSTIIADENRRIIYISPTKSGRLHDLKHLKKTGVLEHIPPDTTLWVDKGYQGMKSVLKHDNQVMMARKKPRGKELTKEQKKENSIIASIRIVVEHAINALKRYKAASDIYRNRNGQDDNIMFLCASLWNFHLQYANC